MARIDMTTAHDAVQRHLDMLGVKGEAGGIHPPDAGWKFVTQAGFHPCMIAWMRTLVKPRERNWACEVVSGSRSAPPTYYAVIDKADDLAIRLKVYALPDLAWFVNANTLLEEGYAVDLSGFNAAQIEAHSKTYAAFTAACDALDEEDRYALETILAAVQQCRIQAMDAAAEQKRDD